MLVTTGRIFCWVSSSWQYFLIVTHDPEVTVLCLYICWSELLKLPALCPACFTTSCADRLLCRGREVWGVPFPSPHVPAVVLVTLRDPQRTDSGARHAVLEDNSGLIGIIEHHLHGQTMMIRHHLAQCLENDSWMSPSSFLRSTNGISFLWD